MARQGGFTYLGLLFAIAFLGLLLAGAGDVWQATAQREREEDLLFVGRQIAQAIRTYHAATPGEPKRWPRRLEDLLEDKRGIETRRHLRKLYRDPMSNGAEWGLVKVGDEIVGVYSLAEGKPRKRANFLAEEESFAGADSYREWRFTGTSAASHPGR